MAHRGYERQVDVIVDVRDNDDHQVVHRDIVVLPFVFSVLILVLLLCYPVAMTITGTGIPAQDIEKPVRPECRPTISDSDKATFLNYIIEGKSRLLYVNITTNMNETCDNCAAFMPMSWVWVSADSSEVSTFLTWQEDYAIWSFGILDMYATRDVQMSLNVSSTCQEKFGETSHMEVIANKLNDMVEVALSNMKHDYNNSMWCFRTKPSTYTKTERHFVRNFRYFVQDMDTVCYELMNNTKNTLLPDRFWTAIPFGISFIALLSSPLLYIYLMHFLHNKSPVPWLSWGGDPAEEVREDELFIYQRFKSPFTFSSILLEPLPAEVWTSVTFKVGSKISLLILSPTVIYVKVLIYHINYDFKFLLQRQIDHNISIGFSSMLFPFEQKSQNFLTLTGGPCILLLIYHVLGIILIIISSVLDADINEQVDKNDSIIPLASLHLDSMKTVNNATLKNKMLNIVAENSIRNFLSCKFFKQIWDSDRIWQLPFTVLFHQIPFLFMSHLVLKSKMKCIAEKVFGVLGIILCFVFGVIHCIFLFAFITIFFASLEFLALLVTYCYIAMVTYPTESAGIFLFAMAALYYLCQCLREIAQKYQHLLILSIEVSEKLETDALLHNRNGNREHPEYEYLHRDHGSLGISRRLFKEIVDRYEPKAITVKKAVVKMILVTCILGWTLKLVFKLHESYDLDPLVRIFSAVIVVSLPKLFWLLLHDFSQETRDKICKVYLENFIESYRIRNLNAHHIQQL